jgi:hypothetical protein
MLNCVSPQSCHSYLSILHIYKGIAERGFALDVVESLRFFLAYEVLKIADIYQFLNADDTRRHFLKLDQFVGEATQNIMKQFTLP